MKFIREIALKKIFDAYSSFVSIDCIKGVKTTLKVRVKNHIFWNISFGNQNFRPRSNIYTKNLSLMYPTWNAAM